MTMLNNDGYPFRFCSSVVAVEGILTSSQSHDCPLGSPSELSHIDLSAPDVEIKPLHSSMLGQDHCFQVR